MSAADVDARWIGAGRVIPTESYSDQPYVVRTDDGAWLCAVTTGAGHEGQRGQHVIAMRSVDQGRSWSPPVRIEPPDGPEASYAVLLKVPSGRVYIFYNHNTDNVREIRRHDTKAPVARVDSLGYYVFKFSDDHGRTWSDARYPIPVRAFDCDRENVFEGRIRFFWNVGKPFVRDGAAYVPLIKVGRIGDGFFAQSEGALLRSPNLLTEPAPGRIEWETLPEGEVGLRAPAGGGPISEEQSYCVLSDGSISVVYRTVDGYPVESYSRDGGRTWEPPRYRRFASGRLMKHPRAANFQWRCANGKYLYWFHNHGGRFIGERPDRLGVAYEDRNPAWLCGGIEVESSAGRVIAWSEPELVLYEDDPYIRMSYPDLIEEDGRYYLTETQKDTARVHEIDPLLLEGLWCGLEASLVMASETVRAPADEGLLLALPARGRRLPRAAPMPALPPFNTRDYAQPDYRGKDLRCGFSLELAVRFDSLRAGQVLLDNRTPDGRGFCVRTSGRRCVELVLNDGRTDSRWESDPVLRTGAWHHVAVHVDGGPKIISFVIDGRFCDGGAWRQFGWGRFSPHLRGASGDAELRIAPSLRGAIRSVRLYGRVRRTGEAVLARCAAPAAGGRGATPAGHRSAG